MEVRGQRHPVCKVETFAGDYLLLKRNKVLLLVQRLYFRRPNVNAATELWTLSMAPVYVVPTKIFYTV